MSICTRRTESDDNTCCHETDNDGRCISETIMICYQCDKAVNYLFNDSRCIDCTQLTREEIEGNTNKEGE